MFYDYLIKKGINPELAKNWIVFVDNKGIVTNQTKVVHPMAKKFVREEPEMVNKTLLEGIAYYKPIALIGCSGIGGIFTP